MIAFSEAVKKVLHRPFCRGGGEGEDCLSVLYRVYGACGVALPVARDGWTLSNYAARYDAGDDGADVLRDLLFSLGEPVDVPYMLAGDLLILARPGLRLGLLPVIYLGDAHVLVIDETHGIVTAPLRCYEKGIVAVRRILGIEHG